jgi:hypothetical protein
MASFSPYLGFTTKAAVGTAVDYLEMPERQKRQPLRIKSVSICDDSSNVTDSQEIGILSGGKRYILYKSLAAGTAGLPIQKDFDLLLGPDDRIYAGFNVATAKDALWLLVLGEYE